MKNMYNLKLNEELKITSDLSIIRVPGGWVYKSKQAMTFVPFNEDSQLTKSYAEQFEDVNRKLERNLGEDWTKANKKDIIDVVLDMYIPF
jgi:hypothetical protein